MVVLRKLPPSSAYKLEPRNQGWGMLSAGCGPPGPSDGGGRSMGILGREEKFSSHWQESCRPPGSSPCDAGPRAAGPHCWA